MARAVLRCFAHCCDDEWPLTEVIYTCSRCGGLLEVHHDLEALKERSGAAWRKLFADRARQHDGPFSSGVWGKYEWVNPGMAMEDIVSLGEGWTPLISTPAFRREMGLEQIRVKMCGTSHTGSFKDLGMTVLVSQVRQMLAKSRSIRAIACASTGDTSAALAAYCAAAGIPAVVLLPEAKISTAQLVQPLAGGALTLALQTDFDGCMRVVQELTHAPDIYLANSMNPLRLEGQKTIAVEICQQLGWRVPDWVVVPGGNLGNISAIGAGFQMALQLGVIDRLPRLVCAQAQHANPLYESFRKEFRQFAPVAARPSLASAIQIGNPVSAPKAIRTLQEFNGVVEQASEAELAEAAAAADRAGLYACPQTGVAIAATKKLIARGQIKQHESVVIISTAHGLKFSEFKERYHSRKLAPAIDPARANAPQTVAPTPEAVRAALDRFLEGG